MKKIRLVILILFITKISISQYAPSELGLFGGVSYYLGDLNPSKHFLFSKPAFGILYRYNFNYRWSMKLAGNYGSLEASDAISKANIDRNLNFRSQLYELSAQVELNFLPYATGDKHTNFSPYIFGGVAFFHFNPRGSIDGVWYKLQPMHTEGQGTSDFNAKDPYSRNNIAFPFGIGFKYNILKYVCIGLEWGMRKTITDYIDDVSTVYPNPDILYSEVSVESAMLSDKSISHNEFGENHTGLQRGSENTKDWYSFAGIFVTFKINPKNKPCPAYSSKKH